MQHLGIGEHARGVAPDPGALLGAGVAVVGAGHHPRELRCASARRVVGQCLGREHEQGRAPPLRRRGGLGQRGLVASDLPEEVPVATTTERPRGPGRWPGPGGSTGRRRPAARPPPGAAGGPGRRCGRSGRDPVQVDQRPRSPLCSSAWRSCRSTASRWSGWTDPGAGRGAAPDLAANEPGSGRACRADRRRREP